MNCSVWVAITLLGISGLVSAAPATEKNELPPLAQQSLQGTINNIRATKKLPVYGLSIVETTDGKVALVSDNGRLAIIGGRWVDLWAGKAFTDIEQSGSLDKIDLKRMGIDINEFAPFRIGSGPKKISVFVDPLCDECRALTKQMAGFGKDYTFNVVLLPFKTAESGIAARRLHCAPDKALALTAFMQNALDSVPAETGNCDVSAVQKAMVTAVVLSIRTAPFFVLEDFTPVALSSRGVKLADILSRRVTK